jgi:hypothetical protein
VASALPPPPAAAEAGPSPASRLRGRRAAGLLLAACQGNYLVWRCLCSSPLLGIPTCLLLLQGFQGPLRAACISGSLSSLGDLLAQVLSQQMAKVRTAVLLKYLQWVFRCSAEGRHSAKDRQQTAAATGGPKSSRHCMPASLPVSTPQQLCNGAAVTLASSKLAVSQWPSSHLQSPVLDPPAVRTGQHDMGWHDA